MKFIILFLLATFIAAETLQGQISPGDLTKAHAKLEGISNCTQCHVLGEKVYNSKCLNCHTEIKELADAQKGYHSSSDVKGKDCWACHSEHHGRNFKIINFDESKFNHQKTGFSLTGAHTKLKCRDCHKQEFIDDPDLKKRDDTFLGLKQACISCHQDFHQNTLGNECASCHNTEKFRPAIKFSHDKAEFKLTGEHKKVECIECHPKEKRNGKDFQKFKIIAFNSCANCHKDPHDDKFGRDCSSCHVTESFKRIDKRSFNHSRTNFPLIGKHQLVTCSDCHKDDLNSKPAYKNCISCHKDYHKGAFTRNNIPADCSVCHNEQGFKPSLYTIEEHNRKEFKLAGAHLAVSCRDCHYKNEEWHFTELGKNCIDCHRNVHGSEISGEFMQNNNCSGCHVTESWHTISFDHGKTEFPLSGKHKTAGCNECHYKADESNQNVYKFASLSSDCVTCHKDIHYGQFTTNGESNCQRCHIFDNWNPVKFDHSKTKFPLEGSHQKVKCLQCHKTELVDGNQVIKFKLEDFKCAACHS